MPPAPGRCPLPAAPAAFVLYPNKGAAQPPRADASCLTPRAGAGHAGAGRGCCPTAGVSRWAGGLMGMSPGAGLCDRGVTGGGGGVIGVSLHAGGAGGCDGSVIGGAWIGVSLRARGDRLCAGGVALCAGGGGEAGVVPVPGLRDRQGRHGVPGPPGAAGPAPAQSGGGRGRKRRRARGRAGPGAVGASVRLRGARAPWRSPGGRSGSCPGSGRASTVSWACRRAAPPRRSRRPTGTAGHGPGAGGGRRGDEAL